MVVMSSVCVMYCVFFFFKQKTAYEMRISDWSSDLCASDLGWHAKETAYFLDREGAAFQHLRIFRVNCQLLPLHVTVKQHRAARMQRTGELLLQQIFGNPALFGGQAVFGAQDAAWADTVAECSRSRP